MKNPLRSGLLVVGGRSVRNSSLPQRQAALNDIKQCADCGDHFRPRIEWHTRCAQCYALQRLWRGLTAYRAINHSPSRAS